MSQRDLGSLPISLGTAVPIEHLMAMDRPRKETHIFLNVRTLFRNYWGSYKDPGGIDVDIHAKEFMMEMDNIELYIHESIPGHLEPVFYLSTHKSLAIYFPEAKLKVASTDKQKLYQENEDYVLNKLLSKRVWKKKVQIFDIEVNGQNSKAYVLSSYPIDLLSKARFKTLALLESHTGKIKTCGEWVSKLNRDSMHDRLPFNVFTIQLLGDGTTFRSSGQRLIGPILELAEDNNWNIHTTRQRVRKDLLKIEDPKLKAIYKRMIQVALG